mgnify:CR=1 FL=1
MELQMAVEEEQKRKEKERRKSRKFQEKVNVEENFKRRVKKVLGFFLAAWFPPTELFNQEHVHKFYPVNAKGIEKRRAYLARIQVL